MQRLTRWAVSHPLVSISVVVALTAVLAPGLPQLVIRTDGATLYPENNAVVERTEQDRLIFREPEQVILLVLSHPGGLKTDSPEGLWYLKYLHREIGQLPSVKGDGVRSVASLVDLRSDAETMSLAPYLGTIPVWSLEFTELITRLRQHPWTDGLFLSENGQAAAYYIPISENATRRSLLGDLRELAAANNDGPFRLYLTGPLVAEATLGDMVLADLARLVPIMVAVIAVMLLVMLRTVGGLLIPMIEALLVLLWTLGLMGWVGAPVTLVTTILPVILMTMAITDEIHLLQRVQHHLSASAGQQAGSGEPKAAVVAGVRDIGRPIVATSLTTSIAFLSFVTASVEPIRQFGLFTAFGIVAAMILSFTMIPSLIAIMPTRWLVRKSGLSIPVMPWERLVTNRARPTLLLGIMLLVATAPGFYLLRVQDSWVKNFDPNDDLAVAEREFNDAYWGSYRFDVVLTGDTGCFFGPVGARQVEVLAAAACLGPYVRGAVTYLDPLGELAEGLGQQGPVSQLSRGQISDLLMLAGMSPDPTTLLRFLTEDGAAARVTLFVNSPDYRRSEQVKEHLDAVVSSQLDTNLVAAHFSGDIPVALEVVRSIVTNQLRSVSWALLSVLVLLLLVFARGREALIAIIPVCGAAVVIFGAMGYGGLPLGIATSMFASLTIGVGVDFGLHILHNYRRERRAGGNHQEALTRTFTNAGQAVRWNVAVLAIGFLVLTASSLQPDRSLGLLLVAAMVACYVTTLLFLPHLLKFVKIALVLFVVGAASQTAWTGETDTTSDPHATRLMTRVEQDFRSVPRLVRIEFATEFKKRYMIHIDRTMWGAVNGDTARTRILYVITEPVRMRGTALIFDDFSAPTLPDTTWLYLRAFKKITRVVGTTYKASIPGTALSYEDSRGFIPVEKYYFSYIEPSREQHANQVIIKAVPRRPEFKEMLGIEWLVIRLDSAKHLIRKVDYIDANGTVFKTYLLVDSVQVGGIWLPQQVRVAHIDNGVYSTVSYAYWSLPTSLDPDKFAPRVGEDVYLNRIAAVMRQAGLDSARISSELGQ